MTPELTSRPFFAPEFVVSVSASILVADDDEASARSLNRLLTKEGYPDGLRNSEVLLLAQIVGIADVFDALTTERPYRCARLAEEAFEALRNEAAKGWRSRELVAAFVGIVNASR